MFRRRLANQTAYRGGSDLAMNMGQGNSTLSILIPSYNQPSQALVTVRHISQIRKKNSWIAEVLISDNCSEDSTYLDFFNVFETQGWLKVFRQRENLGASANIQFLSTQASSAYSLILGCGDLVYTEPLANIFNNMIGKTCLPDVVVGQILTHGELGLTRLIDCNNLSFSAYHKLTTLWAPYQEALPGQIYLTSTLKTLWPRKSEKSPPWPHIETNLNLLSSRSFSVVKVSVPIASVHQDWNHWYHDAGKNFLHVLSHLAVLAKHLPSSGLGVVLKALYLLLIGLPRAIFQDLKSFIRKRQ